jgi:2,4-dienoyl-CoA reductase-like NADH-dependent reductase (Old Yellow Enzyme family)/thioredoxin reductase
MALKLVWQPIRIGNVEIPNRVPRAANTTTISQAGIDEQFIAYHLARARGGAGLSILEAASVHPTSQLSYAIDGATCRGFERLMQAVRPYGMRIFQQLWHGGHHIYGVAGRVPWVASDVPSPFTGLVGMPMGKAEMDEIAAAFATAAQRCRDAGIDGVEVHAGHGYLLQQFLSPLTNTRDDEYGGSLENRMRFPLEVFRAVRSAVGPDFVVGARISASTAAGNVTPAELAEFARRLQEERLISFLDVSYGDYFEMERMVATMSEPAGYQLQPDAPIRAGNTVPRIVTGRFRTLEEVEEVLRAGEAELVSMVRALIADPDLVRKTREGRVEQVRPCIACNQGCVGGLLQVGRMGCAVNPAAGAESLLTEDRIVRAPRSKKVLIVGGGPAGLEAARVAALQGHQVVLAEARAQLGGAIDIAKRAPGLQGIADITDWLQREVMRLGVEVRTHTYMEATDVLTERPDLLVVATGAQARGDGAQAARPGRVAGCDLAHVMSASDLLTDGARALGRTALVLDDVGHYEAIAAAEYLVARGVAVTFVTGWPSFAPKLNGSFRNEKALQSLYRGNFRLLVGHCLTSIHAGHCVVRPIRTSQMNEIAADTVVLVTQKSPTRSLYDELRGRVPDLRLVGDAASPRTLQEAIREGHLAVRSLQ